MKVTLDDSSARHEALNITASIILQAPAGSGKTTILTQRFLSLLSVVDRPEEVLAMTFSRKAANEMQERIINALQDCDKHNPESKYLNEVTEKTYLLAKAVKLRSEKLGWYLLENPSSLRIMTIDGFNRSIAAATPIVAAGAGTMKIAQFPERLYLEAARRTLIDCELDTQMSIHSDLVIQRLDNNWSRLEELLAHMLKRRGHWLRYLVSGVPSDLRHKVELELQTICQNLLTQYTSNFTQLQLIEGQELVSFAIDQLKKVGKHDLVTPIAQASLLLGPMGSDLHSLDRWRALASFALIKSEGSFRKSVTILNGFPPKEKLWKQRMLAWLEELSNIPIYYEALIALKTAPEFEFSTKDAEVIDSLIILLRYAASQLILRFKEVGQVDYLAVAVAARMSLQSRQADTGYILNQDETIRHILIDEFQDTSKEQYDFICALTADWSEGDGRSLFLVGDPMQSIYKFREAEVSIFLKARDVGIGNIKLKSLSLSRNFRSHPSLIDFVNNTFSKLFPLGNLPHELAVPYLPFISCIEKEAPPGAGIHFHALEDTGNFEVLSQAESNCVHTIIKEFKLKNTGLSIAILVSARTHAHHIVEYLRSCKISVVGVDLLPLIETSVVQDLISLTRALFSINDRIAWLSLLRAPWCGLSLADLTLLSDSNKSTTIFDILIENKLITTLTPLGIKQVRRFISALQSSKAEDFRLTLSRRVESLWLALNGPSCYLDKNTLDDARLFIDALAAQEADGKFKDLDDLKWILQGLYSRSDFAVQGAVQVMTIHRAKGLEFDCVILPGLSRKQAVDEQPLLDCVTFSELHGNATVLIAPIRTPDSSDFSPLTKWIRNLNRCSYDRERTRVLYVACTRARSALHLIASFKINLEGEINQPLERSALGFFWPAVSHLFSIPSKLIPQNINIHNSSLKKLRRLSIEYPLPIWPLSVKYEGLKISSAELHMTSYKKWASDTARRAGLVVHKELENIVRTKNIPTVELLNYEQQRLGTLLRAAGVIELEIPKALQRVTQALSNTITDVRGKWLLETHPYEDYVELELTGLYQGMLSSVVIDRCFVDNHGIRWVVDYKTSLHEGGDIEKFIRLEAERYTPQLLRYASFASHLGPEPIRAALYFPLLGRFLEIDLAITN